VNTLAAELEKLGKQFEFHTYPNAGHAFFAVDRNSYRPEAAVDGWKKVFDFFGRHLSA
jgi:carboxymethylenebutenolidase